MWEIFSLSGLTGLSGLAGDAPIHLIRDESGKVHAEVDHLVVSPGWRWCFVDQLFTPRWIDLRRRRGLRRGVPDEAPAQLAGFVTTARVASEILGLRYAKVRVVDYRRQFARRSPRATRGVLSTRQRLRYEKIRIVNYRLPGYDGQVAYPPQRPLRPSAGYDCLNYRP